MDETLQHFRDDHHQFDKGKLEEQVGDEPFRLLNSWLAEAKSAEVNEPNAMVMTTVDENNCPHSRIVYLKELKEEEFVFYTNYNSDKGKQIASNSNVHILFFWPELERQISVSGTAEKVSTEMSDEYFASRPRASKLGAWASHQSEKLENREELEARLETLSSEFPGEVPRPQHWGGYSIFPSAIEFWQGRSSRLHDRIQFERKGDSWLIYRKNP